MSTTDQWMPVIAVKPGGNQLFIGWLDRRNDTNNSLIDVYGRWATIANNGSVTVGTESRITAQSFPPVFAGTLNTNVGSYDPVWAPGDVNLHWWYDWWPTPDPNIPEANLTPSDAYEHEAGEHNGAYADIDRAYFVWSDSRTQWTYHGSNTNVQGVTRYQPDIRLARLPWPQP